MEIPHEDQSSHYDHEKDKFAYLSMRDRIELGKRQVQQSQWGSRDALNEDMSMKAKVASMARTIEEFELRNVHIEAQPQAMPTSFEYIKHPNLTSQPQPQPKDKFAYLSMRDRIELGKGKFNKANGVVRTNAKRSRKVLKIDTLVGDCYDNSMDQPSIENHKVQDDKGLPEPFKASTSPWKRRETNSLDQMGRMPILFGIQGEFSMNTMLAKIEMEVKQRKQGAKMHKQSSRWNFAP
ncbi:hypothetical protein AAG906_027905 [Vitis piasezkii]